MLKCIQCKPTKKKKKNEEKKTNERNKCTKHHSVESMTLPFESIKDFVSLPYHNNISPNQIVCFVYFGLFNFECWLSHVCNLVHSTSASSVNKIYLVNQCVGVPHSLWYYFSYSHSISISNSNFIAPSRI